MTRSSLLAALAADLTAASYTTGTLEGLWGERAARALAREHRVPALRVLTSRPDSAAATLATIFVLGMPVPPARLAAALPALGLDGALELGLVEVTAAGAAPLLDLRPYTVLGGGRSPRPATWWIASDLGELVTGGPLREDHVLGVGGASVTLAGLQLPETVGRALDLGTGCGIQAMHASRWAESVVATDISPRALELASFNAELNGITTIEFRLGSLFEPVSGERFDRIVSNPPFVITPRVDGVPAYEYRDGGLVGDGIVSAMIRGAGAALEPGGVAQLLGNWEYRAAADAASDGLARMADEAVAAGLDVWIVEREVQDAALYAETWIRDGGTRPGPEFDRLYGAWLDDFEARGVERVGFGYLTLRRPISGAPTLRRTERLDGPVAPGAGSTIAATMAAIDWLAVRDDAALAREKLQVAADVTEERHYWPGDEHPAVLSLHQGGGFARTVPAGTALAAVVGACDGDLSIAALCAAIAELLEVDGGELLAEVLPEVRELVTCGMLVAGSPT